MSQGDGTSSGRAYVAGGIEGCVLVVDADGARRSVVSRALRLTGLRPLDCPLLDDALDRLMLMPDRYDAVLLPIRPRAAAAFDVVLRLRRVAATADIAVLLLTDAAPSEAEVVQAAELGVLDFLELPSTPAVLGAKVTAACERTRVVRRLRAELAHAETHATVDPLTGLFNRRHFEVRLLEATAHAKRNRSAYAVVMVDLDHFKAINDRHGHDEGDRVLVELASSIRATLRGEDVAFRFGGEEFVLLLRGCEPGAAHEVTTRLRERLRDRPFAFANGEARPISFSAGIACADEAEQYAGDELVSRADAALYRAKDGGRDRIEVWGATGTRASDRPPSGDPNDPPSPDQILLRTLREARSLVGAVERWIPQGYAQDRQGRWRPVGSDDAARFSIFGAIVRVGGGSRDVMANARQALEDAAPDLYGRVAAGEVAHTEALALLDAGISHLARTRSGTRARVDTAGEARRAAPRS